MKRFIILAFFLACTTGCGSMLINTNQPAADIYFDGQHVGKGSAEVDGTGFPQTSTIRVVHGDEVVERTVSRRVTGKTALVGLFTYLTGFLWAQDFPDEVTILLENRAPKREDPSGGWGQSLSNSDPWAQPMYQAEKKVNTQAQSSKKTKKAPEPAKTKADADKSKAPKESKESKGETNSDPWKKPLTKPAS